MRWRELSRPVLSRSFVLYCVIGASGVSLDTALFYVLTRWFGVHYEIAHFCGVTLGITNNFTWNALLNFKVRDRVLVRYAQFYAVGMVGMLVGMTLLALLVEVLAVPVMLAKLSTVVVVTIIQYTLNVRTSLRRGRAGEQVEG
jgi:dolichol-phosphate mannosyltransferase